MPALFRWHRGPCRADLARFGLAFHTDGVSWSVWRAAEWLSWNEIWDFLSQILRNPSSHLVSALEGDKYVPHPAERAEWAVFEAWLNTQTKKGSGYRRVARPWTGDRPTYAIAAAEDSGARVRRRERLAELF